MKHNAILTGKDILIKLWALDCGETLEAYTIDPICPANRMNPGLPLIIIRKTNTWTKQVYNQYHADIWIDKLELNDFDLKFVLIGDGIVERKDSKDKKNTVYKKQLCITQFSRKI